MTGPEHYRHAETLLDQAGDCNLGDPAERYYIAKAHVHATLALAAAAGNNEAGRGQTVHESNAWYRAAGSKPADGGAAVTS